MSTSNAKQVTTRTLSTEEIAKLTSAFNVMNAILCNYVVGEESLSTTFNQTSAKHATLVTERALHALDAHRISQRNARLAKIGPLVESAIKPFVDNAKMIRDSFKDQPANVIALLKEKGVLSDVVRIPLDCVLPAFEQGATMEYIKDMVTTLKYTVISTRGPKSRLEIEVSLVTGKPVLNVDQQKAANAAASNGATVAA